MGLNKMADETNPIKNMMEKRLNEICGREECLVSDPHLCFMCLGDETNDDYYDDFSSEERL